MQCVVLAGGLGTRMSRYTATIPKALIPVADEPFVRLQLRQLQSWGVTDVVMLTGYLGEMIAEEVEHHAPDGLDVRCLPDGDRLLGTAGAIRRAVSLGAIDETFLLTYGDSYLPIDGGAVFEAFDPERYDALMTVVAETERERPNVRFVEGELQLYRKGVDRPAELGMRHVDYGLSVLRRAPLERLVDPDVTYDLAAVFETLSERGRLQGHEVAVRFYEIGSENGLADLERHLRTGQP